MGVDKAGENKLPFGIEDLSGRVGILIHILVGTEGNDFSIFYRERLDEWLIFRKGVNIGVGDDKVGYLIWGEGAVDLI